MKRSVNNLIGYTINAKDGEIGKVNEFFFDDFTWSIRYLVVDTGNWFAEKKVLIPHAALGKTDWESRTFHVNLTIEQIKSSPDIDTEKTVSRQNEMELFDHYLLPVYWGEGFYATPLGMLPLTPIIDEKLIEENEKSNRQNPGDPHLRSTNKVKGYHIHANDGEIGHLEDFIIEDKKWNLCSLVVDTKNWLSGRRVLIEPGMIKRIVWDESEIYVNVSRETIKNSPGFDPVQTESK
jgi:sporulation protein YlmC with PRC-barrel domain